MILIPNARRVLLYGWNVRWMVISGFFIFLDMALPIFQDFIPISPLWFALISLFVAGVARFISQKKVSGEQ